MILLTFERNMIQYVVQIDFSEYNPWKTAVKMLIFQKKRELFLLYSPNRIFYTFFA